MDNLETIETEVDLKRKSGGDDSTVIKYCAEIDLYEDHFKEYYELCEDIKLAYKDDKKGRKRGRYNVLWSNLENLKPSVLFNLPKVEIDRRYKDKDPMAREASTILERASQYCLDSYPFMKHAERARDEFLLYGRGVMWSRYIPHLEKFETKIPVIPTEQGYVNPEGQLVDESQIQQDSITGALFYPDESEDLTHEEVKSEFIHRDNFGHNVCRTWDEVRLVWRKVYMTRDELVERFGDIGEKIPLNFTPKSMKDKDEDQKSLFRKAEIFEVWDSTEKKVTWISKDYKSTTLDQKEDPLRLKEFFPCHVVYGTLETDSLIPIPDYAMYRAISDELATVNTRISALTRAIRVKGLYPAVMADVAKLASEGVELALIPVENWTMHTQAGGMRGMIDWMPIKEIAYVLRSMYEVKAALKQDLYEISGQSDILRGQTDPRETATAQRGKMQYAGLRLSQKQKTFSEFLRDVIQNKAEIISEHFEDMSIFQMAAVESLGQESVMAFPEAVQLLRNDAVRGYRIDIETDSTIAQDNQEAQGRAVEFFNAMTQGFNDALPIIQGIPEAAEVLTEGLALVARTFKAGRSLDAAIERMGEALRNKAAQPPPQPMPEQQAPQPPPPQMDPRVMAEQIRARSRQEQLAQEGAYKQAQFGLEQQKLDTNTNIELAKIKAAQDEAKAKLMLEGIRQGHDMGLGSVV